MFEAITLGSGSAGNSMLVRGASSVLLVDAGLSARQLTERLRTCGVSPDQLSGILLTHEHSDHSSALKVLLAKQDLPVYCNPLTARCLSDAGLQHRNWKLFQNASDFQVGEFSVRAFSVPHDAVDPVGFRISSGAASLGVLTDLGHATRLVFDMLRGINALLIETNHDEQLLQQDTRRPWSVKYRISSKHGHLSNTAAAAVVAALDAPDLRHVIMGHLSRDCNSPQLAEQALRQGLAGRNDIRFFCAGQAAPSPAFSLI